MDRLIERTNLLGVSCLHDDAHNGPNNSQQVPDNKIRQNEITISFTEFFKWWGIFFIF